MKLQVISVRDEKIICHPDSADIKVAKKSYFNRCLCGGSAAEFPDLISWREQVSETPEKSVICGEQAQMFSCARPLGPQISHKQRHVTLIGQKPCNGKLCGIIRRWCVHWSPRRVCVFSVHYSLFELAHMALSLYLSEHRLLNYYYYSMFNINDSVSLVSHLTVPIICSLCRELTGSDRTPVWAQLRYRWCRIF